jgi:hypothetical protein
VFGYERVKEDVWKLGCKSLEKECGDKKREVGGRRAVFIDERASH